ncbi:MAG TPA: hypothetical protein DCR64_01485, partial [Vibrio sp.]|nr:hypothetical protein [Vibrio sp.]
ASDDKTGASSLGGDWELEYQVGEINSSLTFEAARTGGEWQGLLDTFWISSRDSEAGWADENLVDFTPDVDGFGDATGGTFSTQFDVQSFTTDDVDLTSVHYVNSNLSIGSPSVDLQVGDILFSIHKDNVLLDGVTDVTANKYDVILFHPDTVGDYSSGSFSVVFSNPSNSNEDITGLSLVEEDTQVGDTLLERGTFIFSDDSEDYNIYSFNPTTGNTDLLLDGAQVLSESEPIIVNKISGLELVEDTYSVGGVTLSSGQILVTLDGDGGIYDNVGEVAGNNEDVFVLDITRTAVVDVTNQSLTASLFMDSSDVGLSKSLNAISFADQSLVNDLPVANDNTDSTDEDNSGISRNAASGV